MPPSCSATTRKGQPCKAPPLKGTDYCMAHSPAETRASAGFVPEAGKLGGRPPKPSAADFLREWFMAHEGEILDAMTNALRAERAVVVGNGPKARIEMVPDNGEQMRAVREAFDRYFGRPRQEVEISTSEGTGMGAVIVTDPELQEAARELLHRAAQAAGEDESGGAGGGDQ
jgi:hypothetical protein